MYIDKITIENIRGLEKEVFDFSNQVRPGWHVLLGDNGSGKSTILRAIALAMIGPADIKAFRLDFRDWLRRGANEGVVSLSLVRDANLDKYIGNAAPQKKPFEAKVVLKQLDTNDPRYSISEVIVDKNGSSIADRHLWSNSAGWFAAGFGPFRRFTGGEKDWESLHYSVPRPAALLSVFGENVALTQTLNWLTDLHHGKLDGFKDKEQQLDYFKRFINETGLLPQNTRLTDVNSRGVFFADGNGNEVEVTQLSDGFRTVLSMTFELIRQMIRTYGMEQVFKDWGEDSDSLKVNLPGVVLIDEADVHLHPTWQIEIGEWF
ncbi:MAG TPA: AAA family ATPase, partial [Saprospiraceae bacterium]|nr:AAA family ATPase [Saprospiraceae bacterium]